MSRFFSKNCRSPHFRCVRYKLISPPPLKIMSAVAVTPGAVARIRESKEVLKDELNVQVCFIFFITHHGFRDVVVSFSTGWFLPFFLSFIVDFHVRLKNSINKCFVQKADNNILLFSSFIQVLDFDGSNDAFRCVLFFFFFFFF